MRLGPLQIDPPQHRASWDGRPLELKPKEFDLLLFLARNHDVVLSRDVLLERVWGYDYPVDTRTVDVHIRWLREKIEAQPSAPRPPPDGARPRLPLHRLSLDTIVSLHVAVVVSP